jgi:hypothetical protein
MTTYQLHSISSELPSEDAIAIRLGSIRDVRTFYDLVLTRRISLDSIFHKVSIWISDPVIHESKYESIFRICKNSSASHSRIQLSTVRNLIRNNFKVEYDKEYPNKVWHANIILRLNVSEFEIRILLQSFSEPIPNPAKLRRV